MSSLTQSSVSPHFTQDHLDRLTQLLEDTASTCNAESTDARSTQNLSRVLGGARQLVTELSDVLPRCTDKEMLRKHFDSVALTHDGMTTQCVLGASDPADSDSAPALAKVIGLLHNQLDATKANLEQLLAHPDYAKGATPTKADHGLTASLSRAVQTACRWLDMRAKTQTASPAACTDSAVEADLYCTYDPREISEARRASQSPSTIEDGIRDRLMRAQYILDATYVITADDEGKIRRLFAGAYAAARSGGTMLLSDSLSAEIAERVRARRLKAM